MLESTRSKLALAAAVLVALAALYGALSATIDREQWLDPEGLRQTVAAIGAWGPLLIAGLIALAVVVSPIPSAPIALAAGAAYGHLWGTLYVLAGAELGALVAFALARLLGYDLLRRWFGDRLDVGLLGSQNLLMATVFLTRLMPFVSFDVVSYAAGLSRLRFWRFAVATLAGIVPASFLLAHFGAEMASGEAARISLAVLALGLVTGAPVLIAAAQRWRRRRVHRPAPDAERSGDGAGG